MEWDFSLGSGETFVFLFQLHQAIITTEFTKQSEANRQENTYIKEELKILLVNYTRRQHVIASKCESKLKLTSRGKKYAAGDIAP